MNIFTQQVAVYIQYNISAVYIDKWSHTTARQYLYNIALRSNAGSVRALITFVTHVAQWMTKTCECIGGITYH